MTHRAATWLAALLAAGLSSPPAAAEPARYRLDPQRSFVHFEVLHFGTSTIHGRFGPIEGEVTLDRAARTGEVGLRIPTATVSTGFKFFDSRLRQADLLASDDYPEAYFVASRFRFGGPGEPELAEVRGEFTFRGVSIPLSLHALRFACRSDAPAPWATAGAAAPAAFAAPAGSAPTTGRRAGTVGHANGKGSGNGNGNGNDSSEVCGGDFRAEVRRGDFGATFGLPLVGDRVHLRLQVEGRRL